MTYTWLVEKYLEGELSGEALRKFELEILRNPEAARELERVRSLQKFMENQHAIMSEKGGLVEDYDDMENVIPEHEIAEELEGLKIKKFRAGKYLREFRTRLSEIEAERELRRRRSNTVLVRRNFVWGAAAAMILLLATTSILVVNQFGSADYMALYDRYYTIVPADNGSRGQDNSTALAYESAMGCYIDRNFHDALQQFNLIPEPYPNPAYYLYEGIVLMELGRFDEAITLFSHLESDPVQNHNRMWYTGLCYLGLEDTMNARKTFNAIVEQEGHYLKQSKKILSKL